MIRIHITLIGEDDTEIIINDFFSQKDGSSQSSVQLRVIDIMESNAESLAIAKVIFDHVGKIASCYDNIGNVKLVPHELDITLQIRRAVDIQSIPLGNVLVYGLARVPLPAGRLPH